MLYQLFPFFFSPREFLRSTVQPHQSTARPLERVPNHIKVTRPSSLFIPVAAMGECKQIDNSNLLYVRDVISLIILFMRGLRDFVDAVFPTLVS